MPKPKDEIKGKYETSESITFRIEKTVLVELRQEAGQKMESVNTLANQIINSYISWHNLAKQSGFGYYDKELVFDIMNLLTDEQIIQTAEQYCKHG